MATTVLSRCAIVHRLMTFIQTQLHLAGSLKLLWVSCTNLFSFSEILISGAPPSPTSGLKYIVPPMKWMTVQLALNGKQSFIAIGPHLSQVIKCRRWSKQQRQRNLSLSFLPCCNKCDAINKVRNGRPINLNTSTFNRVSDQADVSIISSPISSVATFFRLDFPILWSIAVSPLISHCPTSLFICFVSTEEESRSLATSMKDLQNRPIDWFQLETQRWSQESTCPMRQRHQSTKAAPKTITTTIITIILMKITTSGTWWGSLFTARFNIHVR